jgi:hypothetical protein
VCGQHQAPTVLPSERFILHEAGWAPGPVWMCATKSRPNRNCDNPEQRRFHPHFGGSLNLCKLRFNHWYF